MLGLEATSINMDHGFVEAMLRSLRKNILEDNAYQQVRPALCSGGSRPCAAVKLSDDTMAGRSMRHRKSTDSGPNMLRNSSTRTRRPKRTTTIGQRPTRTSSRRRKARFSRWQTARTRTSSSISAIWRWVATGMTSQGETTAAIMLHLTLMAMARR